MGFIEDSGCGRSWKDKGPISVDFITERETNQDYSTFARRVFI
jgi:hypothetical protein